MLRLLECGRLRVKDVDFVRREITVRDGKGAKDRVTLLQVRVIDLLSAHVKHMRQQHIVSEWSKFEEKKNG